VGLRGGGGAMETMRGEVGDWHKTFIAVPNEISMVGKRKERHVQHWGQQGKGFLVKAGAIKILVLGKQKGR